MRSVALFVAWTGWGCPVQRQRWEHHWSLSERVLGVAEVLPAIKGESILWLLPGHCSWWWKLDCRSSIKPQWLCLDRFKSRMSSGEPKCNPFAQKCKNCWHMLTPKLKWCNWKPKPYGLGMGAPIARRNVRWMWECPKKSPPNMTVINPKINQIHPKWQNIWVEQVNFSLPSIELLLEVGVYHLLGYTHPSHRRPTDLQQLIHIPVPTNATFLGKESLARTVPRLNMANLQQGRVRYLVFGPNCRQSLGLLPW